MIKKVFKISLFIISLLTPLSSSFSQGCSDNYSFLVFDAKTSNILSENDADEIKYPASLTKLMTLYLTFEAIKEEKLWLDKKLFASDRAVEIAKINKVNTLNLKIGDEVSVKDAIKGSIVKSFNEASLMLAEAIAEDEWHFVELMNKKAKELGMSNTNFRNSTGLHDPGQYSTSNDLAKLAAAIYQDFPDYYHLFSLKEFQYKKEKFKTHNQVLLKYKGAEGMKTGFTKAAGFNLISSAKKADKRVVSVLVSCVTQQKRDAFTKELLDNAFKKLAERKDEIVVKIRREEKVEDEDINMSHFQL